MKIGNFEFNQIKRCDLTGSPYERGFQHGSVLKEWINEAVIRTEYLLNLSAKREIAEIYAQFWDTTSYLEQVKTHTPELLEEVRGIADGADLDFQRIFAYQCNEEIMLGMLEQPQISVGSKCSSLGCGKTKKTSSFIGQNLDWLNCYESYNTLLSIEYSQTDHKALVNTIPGLLMMNGLNNAPIAVCVNSLEEDLNCSINGLPLVFVLRKILEYQTLEEIVTFLTKIPHASAQNFLIGSDTDIIDYECSANKVCNVFFKDNKNRLFHTNHPLVNDDYRIPPKKFDSKRTTFDRFNFLQYRMQKEYEITVSQAKFLLRSSMGPINRLNTGDQLGGLTLFSVIFDLSTPPQMHLTMGPPSRSKYKIFSF